MIQFENNTAPYINADNLNNNFNEAKKHEIATAYLTTNQTSLTQGTILLDDIISNTDKLTLLNNGIKIGSGINKIKISSNIFAEVSPASDYIWCEIRKNDSPIIRTIDGISTNYANANATPILIEVNENDVLTLYKKGPTTNSISIRGLESNSIYNTYLTVEVVE